MICRKFRKKAVALILLASGFCLDTNLSKRELIPYTEVQEAVEPGRTSWDLFTEAVIWKESKGDERAVGDNGEAVGVLQLHRIMVDDANRILRLKNLPERYTYDDRYSREKSIEIFNIIQDYYNKGRDMPKALKIWNSGHPESYKEDIMRKYRELSSGS